MTSWQTKKLGDWGVLVVDGDRGKNYPSQSELLDSGECLFLSATNVTKNGFKFDEAVFIDSKKDAVLGKGKLMRGDIVITTRGTVGNTAHYTDAVPFDNVRINSGMALIRNQPSTGLSTPYLLKYLNSTAHKRQIDRVVFGSAQPQLTIKTIYKLPITAPEKPEQERIVAVLEVWDEYIEKLEQKIALKEQLKKGLMQQLLTGKRRLPSFIDEWRELKLEDVVTFKKGSGLSKEKITSDGDECILYGEIYTKYDEIIDLVISRTKAREGVLSTAGDILIPASTTTSAMDVATAASLNKEKVRLGGDINILRPKVDINSDFLALLLSTVRKHTLAQRAQGVTIIHLYGKDMANIKISIPKLDEQNEIVRLYRIARDEINQLKKKQRKLSLQKKYLLKNLITGTIRTPENLLKTPIEKEATHA